MASGLRRVVQDLENEIQKTNNEITATEWRLTEIARPYLGSCDLSVNTFAEISQLDKERINLATCKRDLDITQKKIQESVLVTSQNVMKKMMDIERTVGINKN